MPGVYFRQQNSDDAKSLIDSFFCAVDYALNMKLVPGSVTFQDGGLLCPEVEPQSPTSNPPGTRRIIGKWPAMRQQQNFHSTPGACL